MESICVETSIKKRKWGILFARKPPNNYNKKLFFEETTQFTNKLAIKFDSIIAGDFNIDSDSIGST